MAQINYVFQMDMNADVSTLRRQTRRNLGRTYMVSSEEYEDVLDEAFIMQCRRIATGYAWQSNIMAETAVRRDREFQAWLGNRTKAIRDEAYFINR